MPAALFLLAFLAATATSAQVTRDAPAYSAATIVNAASGDATALAPYTIIKINGTNLAWEAKSMQPSDIRNSTVPSVLPNTGVRVYVNNQSAGVLSVSPTQITALVPADQLPGPATIRTSLDALSGPTISVTLNPYAPAIFTNPDNTLIVSHENGDLVTPASPLSAGDKMIVLAVGLGLADPPLLALEIPSAPLTLDIQTTVAIYINDNPIDPALITNVGFVPGQAGVYTLTVQLPMDTPSNPEIRIEANGFKSPAGFTVPINGS